MSKAIRSIFLVFENHNNVTKQTHKIHKLNKNIRREIKDICGYFQGNYIYYFGFIQYTIFPTFRNLFWRRRIFQGLNSKD